MPKPELKDEECSDQDLENFKQTEELETNAVNLYRQFAKEAEEQPLKILFTALAKAEEGHIELMKKLSINYGLGIYNGECGCCESDFFDWYFYFLYKSVFGAIN